MPNRCVFEIHGHGDVFFAVPLKYTGLQGPEKRDELYSPYADSIQPFFGDICKSIIWE
jgi:hypothetical protein